MDKHLQVIDFHDYLHGFLKRRDTWTATIENEAKLAQQLALLEQEYVRATLID